MSTLISENACCRSVQNLLYFRLLSINVKIKTNNIIILPVILYGCETLSDIKERTETEGI
jgi:hypothetical protein